VRNVSGVKGKGKEKGGGCRKRKEKLEAISKEKRGKLKREKMGRDGGRGGGLMK
jgi:hypothetical protein